MSNSNTAAKTNYIETDGLVVRHKSFIAEVVPISSKVKGGILAKTLEYRLKKRNRLIRIDGVRCSNLAVEKVVAGKVARTIGFKGTFEAYVGGRWRRLQSLSAYAKNNNITKQAVCYNIRKGKLQAVKLITNANSKGIAFVQI